MNAKFFQKSVTDLFTASDDGHGRRRSSFTNSRPVHGMNAAFPATAFCFVLVEISRARPPRFASFFTR